MAGCKKVFYSSFFGIITALFSSSIYGMQRAVPLDLLEQPEPLRKAYEALSHIPGGGCVSELRSALDYFAKIWSYRKMEAGNILQAVDNVMYVSHLQRLINSDAHSVLLDGGHYEHVFEVVLKCIDRVDRKAQGALIRYAVYLIFAEQ